MALADLHYGYEVNRRRTGALLPDWGMQQCLETLLALLQDHRPQRLILVGDIMDGSGSVTETSRLLEALKPCIGELVLIEGNHDRSGLKRGWPFKTMHREKDFLFHHGHVDIAPPTLAGLAPEEGSRLTMITGHEHPAVSMRDGAGLRLKMPAFVQESQADRDRWILPAFSPWAAGGDYASPHECRTWACTPLRVWRLR